MPIAEARQRLTKEYKALNASPLPYITARPNESNILEWHYIIDGPPDTPYFNGQYHGVMTFTTSYPYAPPSIRMYTPSGRFQPRARLCLSISDFHPESWNPGWSVSTILNGLLSFMTSEEITTGSIGTSYETKLQCARDSMKFNLLNNPEFCLVFPDLVQSNPKLMPLRLQEIDNYQLERKTGLNRLKNLRNQFTPSRDPIKKKPIDKKKLNEDEIRARKNSIANTEPYSFNTIIFAVAVILIGMILKLTWF